MLRELSHLTVVVQAPRPESDVGRAPGVRAPPGGPAAGGHGRGERADQNKLVPIDFPLTPGDLDRINNFLNGLVSGLTLDQARAEAHGRYSLAQRLASGETVYTGWCALGAPIVAESIAREGFPAVTIDQQHGLSDIDGDGGGIASIRRRFGARRTHPAQRLRCGNYALDFGAEGIIAPMIDTSPTPRLSSARQVSARRRAQLGPVAGDGAGRHRRCEAVSE